MRIGGRADVRRDGSVVVCVVIEGVKELMVIVTVVTR